MSTQPTPNLSLVLPDNLRGPEDALAFAQTYANKITPAKQLRRLEEQTVFWLIHDLLHDATGLVVEVSLDIPDSEEDSLMVKLVLDVDGRRVEEDVFEGDAEIGGALFAFLENVEPDYDSQFIQRLSNPITVDNIWQVARQIFSWSEFAVLAKVAEERDTQLVLTSNQKAARP